MEELREKDEFFHSLSDRDWKIYRMIFVEGCSRERVAKQLNIGTATVSRVIQFLRERITKSDTIKRGRKPKQK